MLPYKNVLVAVDLNENYQPLLNEAKRLATLLQAKLHCVNVVPSLISSVPYAYDFQKSMESEANKLLAIIQSESQIETFVLHGNPQHEICALAKQLDIDLIICGSHGKHGLGLILGSTANGILHLAHCDVLTLRLNEEGDVVLPLPYRNVVVATDLKEENKKVISTAKNFAALHQSTLHLVHAVSYTPSTAVAYFPDIEVDLKEEADKNMQKLCHEFGIRDSKVMVGLPKVEINRFAEEKLAELIVIGSHGKSAVVSALLGSTTNALLHLTKSNVLVIRI
jgi:universal stress protein A